MTQPEPGCRFAPTILIVEDNDIVSEFLQETFKSCGYQTLTAVNREEAVHHCQTDGNAIRALIADVSSSGFEIAQTLLGMYPKMKVVFTSGYPFEHLVRAGLLPAKLNVGVFLQKPFLPRELMTLLKSLQ
jgi:CheY-like chemotaxis protein